MESVEWLVAYPDEQGTLKAARDGAQTVFGLTRAKKVAKQVGPPYALYHYQTRLPEKLHVKHMAQERAREAAKAAETA
jgi:hypothetical protein